MLYYIILDNYTIHYFKHNLARRSPNSNTTTANNGHDKLK